MKYYIKVTADMIFAEVEIYANSNGYVITNGSLFQDLLVNSERRKIPVWSFSLDGNWDSLEFLEGLYIGNQFIYTYFIPPDYYDYPIERFQQIKLNGYLFEDFVEICKGNEL